jgi:hypothetical protein
VFSIERLLDYYLDQVAATITQDRAQCEGVPDVCVCVCVCVRVCACVCMTRRRPEYTDLYDHRGVIYIIIAEHLDEVVAEMTRYRAKRQTLKRQYPSTFSAFMK